MPRRKIAISDPSIREEKKLVFWYFKFRLLCRRNHNRPILLDGSLAITLLGRVNRLIQIVELSFLALFGSKMCFHNDRLLRGNTSLGIGLARLLVFLR